jgi:acetyltransferase-like isoleucine patch superfamily enzyme
MKHILKDFRGYIWYYVYKYKLILNSGLSTLIMKFVCAMKGVRLGKNIKFSGIARIHRFPNSKINIDNNCKFNSSRGAIKIGLFKPCSIVTLRKDSQINIGKNVGCTSVTIAAANNITIGDNVLLGANTFIMDSDWHNTDPDQRRSYDIYSKPVIIENNAFLGYNCIVLKGVTIGKNSVIGANSVVLKSIPPNSIAYGNPCELMIKRDWINKGKV